MPESKKLQSKRNAQKGYSVTASPVQRRHVCTNTSSLRMISLSGRVVSCPPMKVVWGSWKLLSKSDSLRPYKPKTKPHETIIWLRLLRKAQDIIYWLTLSTYSKLKQNIFHPKLRFKLVSFNEMHLLHFVSHVTADKGLYPIVVFNRD